MTHAYPPFCALPCSAPAIGRGFLCLASPADGSRRVAASGHPPTCGGMNTPLNIGLGVAIGVVIGLLLDSIGAGIGIGIALAIAFGLIGRTGPRR